MRVCIPTPLYSYTGNRAEVEAVGATIEQVTSDLEKNFPGMRFRIIDEQDNIRPHIKFFLNKEQIFDLITPVEPKDELVIIQAFSGG